MEANDWIDKEDCFFFFHIEDGFLWLKFYLGSLFKGGSCWCFCIFLVKNVDSRQRKLSLNLSIYRSRFLSWQKKKSKSSVSVFSQYWRFTYQPQVSVIYASLFWESGLWEETVLRAGLWNWPDQLEKTFHSQKMSSLCLNLVKIHVFSILFHTTNILPGSIGIMF